MENFPADGNGLGTAQSHYAYPPFARRSGNSYDSVRVIQALRFLIGTVGTG